ncbi:Aldo/keto reductase [Epithele typhae]|uniref:Aldo/keto reductase n=1 Tax=Epithele typhae TaxID=378194 RepID=UPI0020082B0D|nr:Aldo/keto reductase [Epithele typhae]KAH9932829.1 Aldo/keto reductase [Epithele typhae]
MSVITRPLGGSRVSAIGYGAMGISSFYGPVLVDELRMKARLALNAVYESGCTHWDTADVYGDSEELIGKWLKKTGKRNDIFLVTKFGMTMNREPGGRAVNGEPSYAAAAIDRSLKRLGVDFVDLWYLHRADPKVPIEITVRTMAEQVKAGKVKHIGLSEVSATTLRRAHAVHPITAVQVEYSPFSLDIEHNGVLATARELGVKIVAYSPVGRGLLTGKIRSPDDLDPTDMRRLLPRFAPANFPKVLAVVDGIQAIADAHGATPGQVALAWVLAQGDDFLPIPGSTKPTNIHENMATAALQLSREEVTAIRTLAEGADLGERYPAAYAHLINAETPALDEE